jgi:hypothetical protein
MLLNQFLDSTFADLEADLHVLQDYVAIPNVPTESTLNRKNRSDRFHPGLQRVHRFILNDLPDREATLATDATGYNGGKQA